MCQGRWMVSRGVIRRPSWKRWHVSSWLHFPEHNSRTAAPIHQLLCGKDLDAPYHRIMPTTPHLGPGQAHNCFD